MPMFLHTALAAETHLFDGLTLELQRTETVEQSPVDLRGNAQAN